MANAGRKQGSDVDQAKKAFLELFKDGMTIANAMKAVDRSISTYERWRRDDEEFVSAVERVRNLRNGVAGPKPDREVLGFPEFSEKYLDAKVFPHMQNVVDLIEARDPSWVHPSMVFEKGEPDLVMVNMPPEHAKTTSITINYVVYRICMDPNIRVILVSKTAEMAKKCFTLLRLVLLILATRP